MRKLTIRQITLDGRPVTRELVKQTITEELAKIRKLLGAERYDSGQFALAARLYEQMMTKPDFDEFLTLVAYEHI